MKKLLFACLALLPASARATDTTISITVPTTGTLTPMAGVVVGGTSMFKHVITNPGVLTQSWLINPAGEGPVNAADGSIVTLGTKGDTAACTGSITAMACWKQIDLDLKAGVSAPGTPPTSLVGVQGGGTGALPVAIMPGTVTVTALDVATTTAGTAVNALSANHRLKGGFIVNPLVATTNLCINELSTAAGTSSSGSTICIKPGDAYNLAPSANAVSVIASDARAIAGYGYN
jgi:hypothetical protein